MRSLFLLYSVIALLVVGVTVAPPAAAACLINDTGTILLPTLSTQPPPLFFDSLNGVYAYKLTGIVPGVSFELSAVAGSSCFGSVCNPDFNLIFQKAGSGVFADQVGPTFNAAGSVSGNVPLAAQWALIWMRHGPDVPNNDGNPVLAVFNFGQVC